MCGIVTFFGYRPSSPEVDPDELRAIRDAMSSRGPDDEGEWYSPDRRIGLGHRRLSILDLTQAGHQPMETERYVVNFNGEIYNYPELRAMLEREGAVFQSHCDTEVIPHLFARRGLDMLQLLRGMFAFTLIDLRTRRMLVARDPYGIKPLYYADDGEMLRIASQVKALGAGGRLTKAIDPAGAAGFFMTGSIPEPFTINPDIRALPAGHFMWVDETGPSQPKRYFSIAEEFARAHAGSVRTYQEDESVEELRNTARDSIRHHLRADVPVGLFLSSGINSSTIAAIATRLVSKPLRTLTLAFSEYPEQRHDESVHAEAIARRYVTEHSTRVITRQEFVDEMPRLFAAMDQPTIDGANSYFVSKAAAEVGLKVVISGLGGDELLGSNPSFRWIPPLVAATWAPSRVPRLPALYRRVAGALSPAKPKIPALLEFGGSYPGAYLLRRGLFMPWELESILGREFAEEGLRRLDLMSLIAAQLDPDPGTSYGRVAALEASLYMRNQLLRDTDWASMAHSVEVRLPLVDAFLLRRLAPLLLAMRSSSRRLLAATAFPPIPPDVVQRRKTGFLVPLNEWMATGRPVTEPWGRSWARVIWNQFTES